MLHVIKLLVLVIDEYNLLKALSRQYNAPFLFETNVGAGLPVIDTRNNLIFLGDKVTSIQAVLSGSLNLFLTILTTLLISQI